MKQAIQEELSVLPVLRGISDQDLTWLVNNSEVRQVKGGSVLLHPDSLNDTAYIILSGCLEVWLSSSELEANTCLEVGNWVGEMSIIEGSYPSAKVVASTDCRLLSLSGDKLWALIDRSHAIAKNLLHALSARVRRDNEIIREGIEQQRQFAESAQTDFLTDLRNRRWLDEMFPRLLERCNYDKQPLSIIMLDIDHFKKYNDKFGHLAGDRALQIVAATVRDNLRPTDVAARYGGEEFVVIMPNTTGEAANIIAERLCKVIRNKEIINHDGAILPSVTISIGLTALNENEHSEQLIAAADAALYKAKQAGRDRVVAHH